MNIRVAAGLGAVVFVFTLAGATPASATALSGQLGSAPVPAALRPALYGALARDAESTYRIDRNGCTSLQSTLKACFDVRGVHFTGAASPLSLHAAAWGRGTDLTPLASVRPQIKTSRVTYAHGVLSEWWHVLPVGFEQGFTISKRPAGQGRLTLALVASTPANAHKGSLGWGELRYGKLVVIDADGKVVPATLKRSGNRILIAVNDARAAYPLTVDPLIWLEQEVTANDGAANDEFGFSVAISGSTALIAAPYAETDHGAAYVFSESDGSWSQAAKLTAGDGAYLDKFGYAVALSGTTALVSAPYATVNGNVWQGAVYVFSDSGGSWLQVQKLTASDGAEDDFFGNDLALSDTTVIVGADGATVDGNASQGAAYVFSDSGGSWSQVAKLTASDGAENDGFGNSVALSGTTAMSGAPRADVDGYNNQGAVYVFSDSGGSWTQVQKFTSSDETANQYFGGLFTLSGSNFVDGEPIRTVNGNTAQGVAYVFSNSGGSWSQVAKLTASDGGASQYFGNAVAVSGSTALIGARLATWNGNVQVGAIYVYDDSGGSWTQALKIGPSDGTMVDQFGGAIAFSGTTALAGAWDADPNGNYSQGVAYFEGQTDLDLTLSAPAKVNPSANYVSQAISTNSASVTSPAVTVTVAVPASASYVSASATQGSCDEAAEVVTCVFGAISGDGGSAAANVTLKAIDTAGEMIVNTARVAKATPALTASTLTVVNTPPIAQNGNLTTAENMAANGTLQASDADGDPLTYSIVDQPGHGSVTITNASTGAYTYTPNSGYSGSDSFTFKANDGYADSNIATISVTVVAPPVAQNGTLITNENTAASGTLKATDTHGNPLTFSIVDKPGHGNVTINDSSTGAYTYTPNKNYSGSDSFTFKANDGYADSNTATISITVKSSGGGGGGGGGGATGWLTLLALLGIAVAGASLKRRSG
ncbi:MAG: Ig-like domain-containing protein [Gammaproteobacteria bacterium]